MGILERSALRSRPSGRIIEDADREGGKNKINLFFGLLSGLQR